MCSKKLIINVRHKDNNDVQEVWAPQICANALQKCNKRSGDFAHSVQGKLQIGIDLVAEEVVFLWTCYEKFLSNEGGSNPVGGPFNADLNNAFNNGYKMRLIQTFYT